LVSSTPRRCATRSPALTHEGARARCVVLSTLRMSHTQGTQRHDAPQRAGARPHRSTREGWTAHVRERAVCLPYLQHQEGREVIRVDAPPTQGASIRPSRGRRGTLLGIAHKTSVSKVLRLSKGPA